MRDILLVCPQERDWRAIEAAGLASRYRIGAAGLDLDLVEAFDPAAFLAEHRDVPADGVVGTKDLSALLAAVLGAQRGLPGPTPEAVVACQHKPTSRKLQRRVAPESTPAFALLGGRLPFRPPLFAKPVVGRLSQGAVRIDQEADLARLETPEPHATRFAEIANVAGLAPPARGFLAEELLTGVEVTLEGYVHGGRATVIGVTDSIAYPGTRSFERFEYPTRLDDERCSHLADIAARVLAAAEFDGGFFNVEFFVPSRGPAKIVELNPRVASQFAPLVLALHGRSTYDALFALATGEDPAWTASRPDGFATSYVVRVFEDALVEAVPGADLDVEILVRPGRRLSEQGPNDARSFRLAIVYAAGETREEALLRCRERARALTFRLVPVPPR